MALPPFKIKLKLVLLKTGFVALLKNLRNCPLLQAIFYYTPNMEESQMLSPIFGLNKGFLSDF